MYCKFCGNRITSNKSTKCMSCGAEIDLFDGGQTFYDDHELDAWQPQDDASGTVTYMPTTELLDEIRAARRGTPVNSRTNRGAASGSGVFDALNLSDRKSWLIFCIMSAVIIIALSVAIVIALNSKPNVADDDDYFGPGLSIITTSDTGTAETTTTGEPAKKELDPAKTQLKKFMIFYDGQPLEEYKVPAYMINEILYISIDEVLVHDGYSFKGNQSKNEAYRVMYTHSVSKNVIEIDVDKFTEYKKVWTSFNGNHNLDGANYYINEKIYVPAESFLKACGYEVEYRQDNGTLTVKK